MIHVWLALDPEDRRVLVQAREFAEGDFPRGLRGLDWPVREADVDETTWAALLSGELTPEEQNAFHRTLWTENGDTPWPST
ncbi:hypothetical protein JNUCC0626_18245 [Lentzea sp. JNUCC 0626]|uniref:hypothetical protein n=1 Tax=Lentzea sp. JNUCC 0626 TaxID=3367513 RepID=UPI003749C21B